MGMTTYLANKLLDHVHGVAVYTPETLYASLYSAEPNDAGGGTELTGNGYARIAVPDWLAAASRKTENDGILLFAAANGGDWLEVGWVGIHNAISGGDLLEFTAIIVPRTALDGDQLRFTDNDLDWDFLASADG